MWDSEPTFDALTFLQLDEIADRPSFVLGGIGARAITVERDQAGAWIHSAELPILLLGRLLHALAHTKLELPNSSQMLFRVAAT